jgi:hypothetical protein
MLNKYDTANQVNIWLGEIAKDETKDIKSVSITGDNDSYILAVILYEPKCLQPAG